jgi:hypothetical protein
MMGIFISFAMEFLEDTNWGYELIDRLVKVSFCIHTKFYADN